MNETTQAIVADAFGPPESLGVQDVPLHLPGPGQVRIKVHYAGISFVDILIAAGKHQYKPALPYVPGSEFSGEVVAVGEAVSGFTPGDRVCGGNQAGLFARHATLPASRLQKLPAHVSMQAASVLRASFITAWYALITRGKLAAGETVVVLGAAGAVGIAACQLARLFGATVIASASTEAKRGFALANGAAHAVDSGDPDWRQRIRDLTGGRGPDVVVDSVGGAATEAAFRSLNYNGRHLVVGFASGTIPALPINLALLKGASLVGVLATHFAEKEPQAEAAARDRILELFAEGAIAPPVGQVFALQDHVAAMQAVTRGDVMGRVLLHMP